MRLRFSLIRHGYAVPPYLRPKSRLRRLAFETRLRAQPQGKVTKVRYLQSLQSASGGLLSVRAESRKRRAKGRPPFGNLPA